MVTLALGVEPLLSARGLSRLRARMFDEALGALDVAGANDDATRAEVLLARGFARRDLGESVAARDDFEGGYALATRSKRPELAAVALTRLGEMNDLLGDTQAARARFDEARVLLANAPEASTRALVEAEVHLRIGHACRREGDLPGARSAVALAAEPYRALGHDEGLASAIYELAVIAMFAGEHDEAFERFDEGLRGARRGDVRVMTGAFMTARGCLLQDVGRLDEALDHHAEAARIFQEVGSRYREASVLYYLATTYVERDSCRTSSLPKSFATRWRRRSHRAFRVSGSTPRALGARAR